MAYIVQSFQLFFWLLQLTDEAPASITGYTRRDQPVLAGGSKDVEEQKGGVDERLGRRFYEGKCPIDVGEGIV